MQICTLINQFDKKVPKGLISGMLNKGIEMGGFWSGFKPHFYKKKVIVHIKGRK